MRVGGHRKLYASYSEGTLPGGFNTSISPYLNNPAVLAQIQSILGISTPFFKEEQLKIGEIGFKGNFMQGRAYLDINGYYGELNGQQIRAAALIPLLGFSVSVTSVLPWSARPRTSRTTSARCRLRSGPLVYGTIQKVHL